MTASKVLEGYKHGTLLLITDAIRTEYIGYFYGVDSCTLTLSNSWYPCFKLTEIDLHEIVGIQNISHGLVIDPIVVA